MSNANERCPACGEATLRFFRKVGKYRCIASMTIAARSSCPISSTRRRMPTPTVWTSTACRSPSPIRWPMPATAGSRLPAHDRFANAIFACYQAMGTTALLLCAY